MAVHILAMAWDLGKAMRKKEEFESSRLMDFQLRHRARAARLLARQVGLDESALARESVTRSDSQLLDLVEAETGRRREEVAADYRRCLLLARKQLIRERGDPTPYRLG